MLWSTLISAGKQDVQESIIKNMLSDVVSSVLSPRSLTNEALVATEQELVTLRTRPEFMDEEAEILSAVLASVRGEITKRLS